eukprot:SAG11_NODE_2182_length_3713_cov_8.308799_2_plen_264_part_00
MELPALLNLVYVYMMIIDHSNQSESCIHCIQWPFTDHDDSDLESRLVRAIRKNKAMAEQAALPLAAWLEGVAGLSGAKLQNAVALCAEQEIDDTDELNQLHVAGTLGAVGFKPLSFTKIQAALAQPATAAAAEPEAQPAAEPSAQVIDVPGLGSLTLGAQIARGGAGVVYAATLRELAGRGDSREVAVKTLAAGAMPHELHDLSRELRILAQAAQVRLLIPKRAWNLYEEPTRRALAVGYGRGYGLVWRLACTFLARAIKQLW